VVVVTDDSAISSAPVARVVTRPAAGSSRSTNVVVSDAEAQPAQPASEHRGLFHHQSGTKKFRLFGGDDDDD